jgi:hypothetical protein
MTLSSVHIYKLGDPTGEIIAKYNCIAYDRVRKILLSRCINCDYVCSTDVNKRFAIAGKDPVCELCCDMYKALTFNPGMRNMNYFRNLIEEEEKEKKAQAEKRRRLGLDEIP